MANLHTRLKRRNRNIRFDLDLLLCIYEGPATIRGPAPGDLVGVPGNSHLHRFDGEKYLTVARGKHRGNPEVGSEIKVVDIDSILYPIERGYLRQTDGKPIDEIDSDDGMNWLPQGTSDS